MPTYVAQCSKCGAKQDFIRTVAKRDETPSCCEQPADRLGCWAIAPDLNAIAVSTLGLKMPDGTYIEGRTQYYKYLKDTKSIPASEGKEKAADARRNQVEAADKARRKAVIEAVTGAN